MRPVRLVIIGDSLNISEGFMNLHIPVDIMPLFPINSMLSYAMHNLIAFDDSVDGPFPVSSVRIERTIVGQEAELDVQVEIYEMMDTQSTKYHSDCYVDNTGKSGDSIDNVLVSSNQTLDRYNDNAKEVLDPSSQDLSFLGALMKEMEPGSHSQHNTCHIIMISIDVRDRTIDNSLAYIRLQNQAIQTCLYQWYRDKFNIAIDVDYPEALSMDSHLFQEPTDQLHVSVILCLDQSSQFISDEYMSQILHLADEFNMDVYQPDEDPFNAEICLDMVLKHILLPQEGFLSEDQDTNLIIQPISLDVRSQSPEASESKEMTLDSLKNISYMTPDHRLRANIVGSPPSNRLLQGYETDMIAVTNLASVNSPESSKEDSSSINLSSSALKEERTPSTGMQASPVITPKPAIRSTIKSTRKRSLFVSPSKVIPLREHLAFNINIINDHFAIMNDGPSLKDSPVENMCRKTAHDQRRSSIEKLIDYASSSFNMKSVNTPTKDMIEVLQMNRQSNENNRSEVLVRTRKSSSSFEVIKGMVVSASALLESSPKTHESNPSGFDSMNEGAIIYKNHDSPTSTSNDSTNAPGIDYIDPNLWSSNSLNKCERCGFEFNIIIRKHHCRKCGHLICHKCSIMDHGKIRICRECHKRKASMVS